MPVSFSISSKSRCSRLKKPSASFFASAYHPAITSAADSSSARNYVTEFNPEEAPQLNESKIRPIAPIPNEWRPMKKLINLTNLTSLSQTDSSLQFELDPCSNPEATDNSVAYGLNLPQPLAANGGLTTPVRRETMSELRRRDFKEYLKRLPDDPCRYDVVPVEGYGAAVLSGYGWKEGQGIGLNAKEDIKVSEVIKRTGRGRLAFLHNWAGKEDRKRKRILIHERKAEKKRTKEIILMLFLMMWSHLSVKLNKLRLHSQGRSS